MITSVIKERLLKLGYIHIEEAEKMAEDSYGEGYIDGCEDAFEGNSKIIYLTNKKLPDPSQIFEKDKWLVNDWKFNIDKQIEAKIIGDFNEKFEYPPNDSQWKMILSNSPNSYVMAGAGSGKSKSLINRIFFLNYYLGISLEHITAFSFTRESTKDLRNKLIETYKVFGLDIPEKTVKRVIRTFHSKIFEFGRKSGIVSSPADIFENDKDDEDVKDETEVDNLLSSNKLSNKQNEFLKGIYRSLYTTNDAFKKLVINVYRYYLRHGMNNGNGKKDYLTILKIASERDKELALSVHELFNSSYKMTEPLSFQLNNIHSNLLYYANGYIEELDIYIVFTPKNLPDDLKSKFLGAMRFKDALTVKRRLLNSHSNKHIRFFNTQEELNRFEEEINFSSKEYLKENAPPFKFALKGEIVEEDIWVAFYNSALFIENLGIEVEDIKQYIKKLSDVDKDFAEALIIFWNYFEEELRKIGKTRYHHILRSFSEDNIENYRHLFLHNIKSMTHILIDEFQDISPEIVKWIRGVLKAVKHNKVNASIMCVGDDWQSIYGWRGSSPRYIINYNKEFVSSSPAECYTMVENYRCNQDLINSAEKVLTDIQQKTNKHGISQLSNNGTIYNTLNVIPREDDDLIKGKVKEILKKREKGETVLILSRTNSKLNSYRQYSKIKGVKVLSYHRSKGLEADYCILIGDCNYNTNSQFKNLVYKIAGHGEYNEVQYDEAMRLAYVAITRAKKECWWFAESMESGAVEKINKVSKKTVNLLVA